MSRPLWLVRPGGRQSIGDTLRSQGVVAIGLGRHLGGIPHHADRAELFARMQRLYPTWRPGRHRSATAQLWSFLHEMAVGDDVLTYDSVERCYYLGTIASDAHWEAAELPELPLRRQVRWSHRVEAGPLPPDTRAALNVLQTLFAIAERHAHVVRAAAQDLSAPPPSAAPPPPALPTPVPVAVDAEEEDEAPTPAAQATAPPPASRQPATAERPAWAAAAVRAERGRPAPASGPLQSPPEAEDRPRITLPTTAPSSDLAAGPSPGLPPGLPQADSIPPVRHGVPPEVEDMLARVEEQADQLLEARIAGLGTSAVRALVAGVLRAMGYPDRRPGPRPDAAFELYAAPDSLGLREPALAVRVEHRRGQSLTADELRRLLAVAPPSGRVLIACTGGFTRAAREVAAASRHTVTLLDLPELRRAIQDHYERIDLETRSLVPLRRIYWPSG